eukprot:s1589_g13.t1
MRKPDINIKVFHHSFYGIERPWASPSAPAALGFSAEVEQGTYAGRFTPTLPGIYKLQLEQAVPGIFAEYWWHRNIHRNAPQQPDLRAFSGQLPPVKAPGMTSSLLLVVLPVLTLGFGRDEGCSEVVEVETTAQLQLKERRHSDSVLQKQSSLRSRLTVLDNSLYWQGYGSESLASYFIGFLGHDTVQVGGLNISAKVGLNLMGNALSGNFYQSVQADAAVLGLLPGCFTGGCSPAYYDDLLSTIAREGKIRRAFSLCFDDSPRGGGKLFLGRPEIPSDAVKIPLHPLTDGLRPYAPLSTFGPSGAGVEFFFGSKRVGSRSSEEWNRLMRSGAGYTDTGTPGLVLPSVLLDEILTELRRKILADEMCASMWGPYLPKFSAQHLEQLTVSSGAANCAMAHLEAWTSEDFVVQLGPDVSLNISKSSFFYETAPCSKQLKISWTSSGNAETFIFGTAFNYGKTVLYDTSDLEAPKLILLGRANGCSANWAELATQSAPGQLLGLELPVASPIELQGLPWQVLGRDGTMTATLMIGSPPQEGKLTAMMGPLHPFAIF